MFTLEESALLGFMLRIVAGIVAVALLAGGVALGVRWMHAHHHHIPHPHWSLAPHRA